MEKRSNKRFVARRHVPSGSKRIVMANFNSMRSPFQLPILGGDAWLPSDLSGDIGTPNYYLKRAEDYERRNPGKRAPSYYRDYGYKYANRFLALEASLSPVGQKWLRKTLLNLQVRMEAGLRTDPFLEDDEAKFRSFAYDTHPEAYISSGLYDLPYEDLLSIAVTPDFEDLLNEDGIAQIWDTAGWLVRNKAKVEANNLAQPFADFTNSLTTPRWPLQ
jgi:hypothetical protein